MTSMCPWPQAGQLVSDMPVNRNLHIRGYKEEGTITTAFDVRVQNELDRFHLVMDVVDRVPGLGTKGRLPEATDGRQADRT